MLVSGSRGDGRRDTLARWSGGRLRAGLFRFSSDESLSNAMSLGSIVLYILSKDHSVL